MQIWKSYNSVIIHDREIFVPKNSNAKGLLTKDSYIDANKIYYIKKQN
ncbi:hypothetical protein MCAV_08000 [[Mycoplasma] cavipharyngis]